MLHVFKAVLLLRLLLVLLCVSALDELRKVLGLGHLVRVYYAVTTRLAARRLLEPKAEPA